MGTEISRSMMAKAIACGIVGVLAVAIAPILLTRLYELELIGAETIGLAICVEFIGMAAGSVLGARILGVGRTSYRIVLTCVALAAANVATPLGGDLWIIIARGVAGFIGGMLIWVTITTIVRSTTPERWSGIYLSGHTAVQFAVAAIIAAVIVPLYSAIGGYAVLAACSILLIPVALTVPDLRPQSASEGGDAATGFPPVTWLALASILLMNGMFSSLISYAEVEYQHRGFPVDVTLGIVPIMLGAQILGGIVAAIIAPKSPKAAVILIVTAVLGGVIWVLAGDVTEQMLFIAFAVFGFCWLLVGPFHLGFILNVTGSRQSAELLAAAQLVGLASGPLLAAGLLLPGGYPPSTYHLALLGASAVILIVALFAKSPARARKTA